MKPYEILDPNRPGRRSGIHRLVYRPAASSGNGNSQRGSGARRDERSWPAIRDQLRRTVNRTPEVVINVQGSRRPHDNDQAANRGVLRYMMYVSRNGRLLTMDEHGEQLDGRDAIQDTYAAWDLDMQRMRGARGEALHPSFNIIFSMPARTDPDRVFDAVQAFARAHFFGHQYVMALHTRETDPSRDPPEHPHVHLILRAENEDGVRIQIRKGSLRIWREQFAAELRARGIDANATSRSERGKSLKARRPAEWHIQKRYEQSLQAGKPSAPPRAGLARYRAAVLELQAGTSAAKPWEIAMAARRRAVLRELAQHAARLCREGDLGLAECVERFITDLAPLDTERRKIQRALMDQVQRRLQQSAPEQQEDKTR